MTHERGCTETAKSLLANAVGECGESVDDLICFWQERWDATPAPEIHECAFSGLPEREFDSGFGLAEGELVIAFGPRYIYIRGIYDGQEWMEGIPRDPAIMREARNIPEVGGE